MRRLYICIICASAPAPSSFVDAFATLAGLSQGRAQIVALSGGYNTGYEFDDFVDLAATAHLHGNDDLTLISTTQPSWYEDAYMEAFLEEEAELLASANTNNNPAMGEDDAMDKEWQELCAIDDAFHISPSEGGAMENAKDAKQKLLKRRRHRTRHPQLFRYSADISVACWLATAMSEEVLRSCGFAGEDVKRMSSEYPKLLKLNAKDAVAPKLRFLVNVLGGGKGDIGTGLTDENENLSMDKEDFAPHNLHVPRHVRRILPTKTFFDSRLETELGPRHAYLALHGDALPHGKELIESPALLRRFLEACSKKPAEFARLCNDPIFYRSPPLAYQKHTAEMVEAMDNAFSDGLLPFAQNKVTSDLGILDDCTPARMMSLLLNHGANYAEHDDWGSTALHHAAGHGNLGGVRALVQRLERDGVEMEGGDVCDGLQSTCASCSATKDRATPLHWAACGMNRTRFGSGGHADVCTYLLDRAGDCDKMEELALANAKTESGATPFMWACWSGSVDCARVLVERGRADPFVRNARGFDAAHFASAGGHVDVCRYLKTLGLEFEGNNENGEGETPLICARKYGRDDVVDWIEMQRLGP